MKKNTSIISHFFIRKKLKLLLKNKKFQKQQSGRRTMIGFIILNLFIVITQIMLGIIISKGNIFVAEILLVVLFIQFIIKILYIFSHSRDLSYSIIISLPIISFIIPIMNLKKLKYPI